MNEIEELVARLGEIGELVARLGQAIEEIERMTKVRSDQQRNQTLEEVLSGLRSEDDTTQLRAIIASIESLRT